jgi:hypothetical protein
MKRVAIAIFLGAILAGPALAGQCPVDMKKIDAALAQNPQISAAQLAEVTELRAQGEVQHKGRQHGASVKTLAKAMEILGIM